MLASFVVMYFSQGPDVAAFTPTISASDGCSRCDYRMDLLIEGKEFERPEQQGRTGGSGPILHTDPDDINPELFDGENIVVTGRPDHLSYRLMPLIPIKCGREMDAYVSRLSCAAPDVAGFACSSR